MSSSDDTKNAITEMLDSIGAIHGSKANLAAGLAMDIVNDGLQHALLRATFMMSSDEGISMGEINLLVKSMLEKTRAMAVVCLSIGLEGMPTSTKVEITKIVVNASKKLEADVIKVYGFTREGD